jgi:putative intracellular protease/amidase
MGHRGEVVLVLPSSGYPGGALLALVRRLEAHVVPFEVAAPRPGRCRGTGGVSITATRRTVDVQASKIGGLLLLDGATRGLAERSVIELVRAADRLPILIAAVAHATLVLAEAGVLHGCAVAADADTDALLRAAGATPVLAPLLVGGHLMTATEAGAAALGDALHDLRGTGAVTHEAPT